MRKYIFGFNVEAELSLDDHLLILDLKFKTQSDIAIFPFTSNGLPGQSIWINENDFVHAAVETQQWTVNEAQQVLKVEARITDTILCCTMKSVLTMK